jgi:hypothetical protein
MSNKIYSICRNIRAITDKEFQEIEELSNNQASYINPLKGAKQSKRNRLGNNNLNIIAHLKQIQEIIKDNKP